MRSLLAIASFALLACSPALAAGDHAGHGSGWSYEGATGPSEWGRLEPEFGACAGRSNQSPIDITQTIDAALPPIAIRYAAGGIEVLNNSHTVHANFKPGSAITVDGIVFELEQFVMKHALTASRAQIEQFLETLGFANNRPVQPVFARPVLR